jgi:hypothetical protein
MKRLNLSLVLTLAILALGAALAWGATATFTPPPQEGTIFAVINADRSVGARTTQISVRWGNFQRTVGRGNPYGNCAGTMAGFVLMIRNTRGDSSPFTLTTTGRIARAPYQGMAPPEVSHPCYKLEKMRVS